MVEITVFNHQVDLEQTLVIWAGKKEQLFSTTNNNSPSKCTSNTIQTRYCLSEGFFPLERENVTILFSYTTYKYFPENT